MLYKLIDEYTVIPCPENGVSQGEAITNLPLFYEENPQRALSDGYKPLTFPEMPETNEDEVVDITYEDRAKDILVMYNPKSKG